MADEASTSASASRRPTTDTYEGLSLSWPQLEFHFVGRGMIRPTGRLFIPFVRPFKNRRSFKDPGQTLARHSTHCIQTGILPGAFSPRVCLYRARQCTQTSLERKQTWRGNARRIDFGWAKGTWDFPVVNWEILSGLYEIPFVTIDRGWFVRILGDWEEIKEESLNGDFFFFFLYVWR